MNRCLSLSCGIGLLEGKEIHRARSLYFALQSLIPHPKYDWKHKHLYHSNQCAIISFKFNSFLFRYALAPLTTFNFQIRKQNYLFTRLSWFGNSSFSTRLSTLNGSSSDTWIVLVRTKACCSPSNSTEPSRYM